MNRRDVVGIVGGAMEQPDRGAPGAADNEEAREQSSVDRVAAQPAGGGDDDERRKGRTEIAFGVLVAL